MNNDKHYATAEQLLNVLDRILSDIRPNRVESELDRVKDELEGSEDE